MHLIDLLQGYFSASQYKSPNTFSLAVVGLSQGDILCAAVTVLLTGFRFPVRFATHQRVVSRIKIKTAILSNNGGDSRWSRRGELNPGPHPYHGCAELCKVLTHVIR